MATAVAHKYFRNRKEAGRVLAQKLSTYANRPELKVVILALSPGGVAVGYYTAIELNAPLDVFLLRQLVIPDYPEYVVGFLSTGGTRVLDEPVVRALNISHAAINAVAVREQQELKRCERLYRGNRALPELQGRTVIVVDDGTVNADALQAAVKALRAHHPSRVIIALPVCLSGARPQIRAGVDDVICAFTPESLRDVRLCYQDFPEISEAEVIESLAQGQRTSVTLPHGG